MRFLTLLSGANFLQSKQQVKDMFTRDQLMEEYIFLIYWQEAKLWSCQTKEGPQALTSMAITIEGTPKERLVEMFLGILTSQY